MTGGLRICQIELPFGILSVWRDFAGKYRLESTTPLGCDPLRCAALIVRLRPERPGSQPDVPPAIESRSGFTNQ